MAARILVVEDEPAVQELIRYTLEQAGMQAVTADSAEEALVSLRDELPDARGGRALVLGFRRHFLAHPVPFLAASSSRCCCLTILRAHARPASPPQRSHAIRPALG